MNNTSNGGFPVNNVTKRQPIDHMSVGKLYG